MYFETVETAVSGKGCSDPLLGLRIFNDYILSVFISSQNHPQLFYSHLELKVILMYCGQERVSIAFDKERLL